MKKIILYLPAIALAVFYAFVIIVDKLTVSPLALIIIGIFVVSGIFMSKGNFWGGFIGLAPAVYMIIMGSKEIENFVPYANFVLPMGIIFTSFYALCCVFLYRRGKMMSGL